MIPSCCVLYKYVLLDKLYLMVSRTNLVNFLMVEIMVRTEHETTLLELSLKDVFGLFVFSIDLFYIYIYCRKFNAEFNKLYTP